MSVPAEPVKPQSSAFSRYFFVFLLGLALGAIGIVMLMRTLDSRKTWQDRWHDAAMNVMNAHVNSLGDKVKLNRCNATDTLPHLQSLRALANDLEPAFPDLRDDQRFTRHASGIRAALDAALQNPPINCDGVGAIAGKVGEACKACHQDFR